jgi:hypothetical protein
VAQDVRPVVTGAVEGDLDEAVIRRIMDYVGLSLGAVHGRRGKPFLLQSIAGYNNAARFSPWMVLVDLDRDCECAPPCIQQWLPNPAAEMCFRVAVRAVEAWLLADRERIAELLAVRVSRVPENPDNLHDPKIYLVNLARHSRRGTVRDDFQPRRGSGRPVGPLYTARMIEFVEDGNSGWRPEIAAGISNSLARCVERLSQILRPRGN